MFSITTSRRHSKTLAVWGALVLGAATGVAGCDKVPLLAPTASTITLSTNTSIVQANGTAAISATVLESSGTPVQNGTTVTFSTNLGTVSPTDARTLNGVATAQFVANGQSGVAEIRATSGAAKPSDTANPTLKLSVGGAATGHVQVTANPTRLGSGGGTSAITAVVTDTNGNLLSGVPVSFSTTAGSLSSLSASTNGSGQATVTLTTSREAVVTATTGSTAGTNTVTVTVGTLPTLTFGTSTPATPTPNQIVTIPLTIATVAGNDQFQNVTVNFGDNQSRDLGAQNSSTSVSHAYASDGIFTVTATGTGTAGDRTQTTTQVAVGQRVPIGISVTASPNPVAHGALTTLTVVFDGTAPTNVTGYDWSFGDGKPDQTTTGKSTGHVYDLAAGSPYTARVTVRTTDGNSGNAQTQVVVSP